MSLAEKIRKLRLSKRWSQTDLARAARIPQPTISRLENGNIDYPKADTLMALAGAFGVPVDSLLHDDYQIRPGELLRTDAGLRDLVEQYARMSEENRNALTELMRLLSAQDTSRQGWEEAEYKVKLRIRKE